MTLAACTKGAGDRDDATAPPGSAETDRIVQVVADAISYPRQDSAAGLARATMATPAGRDGRLTVLTADDLGEPDAGPDPDVAVAQLVLRVDLDEPANPGTERVVACYEVRFTYYGLLGPPERAACPDDPAPYLPPPTASAPTLAPNALDRVRFALESLPPRDRHHVPAVRAAVSELGPGARLDVREVTIPPASAGAATDTGPVVGVALQADDDCVMARVLPDGTVDTWSPPRATVHPGEASCDATTATNRPSPPH